MFYCKGLHNSAICTQRERLKGDSPIVDTQACHVKETIKSTVLLQTADVILENPITKQSVKIKLLLDSGSQRIYISQRIKNVLNLKSEFKETVNINTFGNSRINSKTVDIVKVNVHTCADQTVTLLATSYPIICTPLKNQPVNFVKDNFVKFRDLNFADNGHGDEIDLLIGSDYYWELELVELLTRILGMG